MCHFVDQLGTNLEEIEINNISSSLTSLRRSGIESFEELIGNTHNIKSLIIASNNKINYKNIYLPHLMHTLIDHYETFSMVCEL